MVEPYIDDILSSFSVENFKTWSYEEGFFQRAILSLYLLTNKEKYLNNLTSYYNEFIKNLPKLTEEVKNSNLLFVGQAIFLLYEYTEDEKYLLALNELKTLYKNLKRNDKGLVESKTSSVFLDDNCKALYFATYLAKQENDDLLFSQIKESILALKESLFEDKEGLFLLFFQEGADKIFSLESLSLLALLLVDYLEYKFDKELQAILFNLINSLEKYKIRNKWPILLAEEESLDLDITYSLLLCYVYLKASKTNILPLKYYIKGIDIFQAIKKKYLKEDDKGLITLEGLYWLGEISDNDKKQKATYYNLLEKPNAYIGFTAFTLVYTHLKKLQK